MKIKDQAMGWPLYLATSGKTMKCHNSWTDPFFTPYLDPAGWTASEPVTWYVQFFPDVEVRSSW